MSAFEDLPQIGAAVQTVVVIPARDEADHISRALAALFEQRTSDGQTVDPRSYETIVFANTCRDETASIARAFARERGPRHTVHVVEERLRAGTHVGTARRLVMDAALERLERAGRPEGWIASTDADTVVASDWLAALRDEAARGVDAVMGRVRVAPADRPAFSPDAARVYGRHLAYNRAVARAEAAFDPIPWDPLPRHNMQYAACLAVRAEAYARAGGLPDLPRGEDTALYAALARCGARVRHSPRFLASTSPRSSGRVEGGFATFVRQLHDAAGPERWLVEQPEETLHHIRARAALRAYHHDGDVRSSAYRDVLVYFRLDFAACAELFDRDEPFGANLERFERSADERGVYAGYGRVPVARAIAALREACEATSRSAMRTSVASGAG